MDPESTQYLIISMMFKFLIPPTRPPPPPPMVTYCDACTDYLLIRIFDDLVG